MALSLHSLHRNWALLVYATARLLQRERPSQLRAFLTCNDPLLVLDTGSNPISDSAIVSETPSQTPKGDLAECLWTPGLSQLVFDGQPWPGSFKASPHSD
jgi:hypothetical protein